MQQEVILLKDVLAYMDSGQPFSMTFITADRRRGTGGEIVRVVNWIKGATSSDPEITPTVKKRQVNKLLLERNPNHFINKTRNIRSLKNIRVIRKVHVRLIVEFNGKKVA